VLKAIAQSLEHSVLGTRGVHVSRMIRYICSCCDVFEDVGEV